MLVLQLLDLIYVPLFFLDILIDNLLLIVHLGVDSTGVSST